jgi:hypothetical protein
VYLRNDCSQQADKKESAEDGATQQQRDISPDLQGYPHCSLLAIKGDFDDETEFTTF